MPQDWFHRLMERLAEPGDVLVLCRTSGTVAEVYRRLARAAGEGETGWTGLRVVTLDGYLREHLPLPLTHAVPLEDPAPQLPAEHPWATSLADRPRLRRHLRKHLERVHALAQLAGGLPPLSEPVETLVAAGWGQSEWTRAAVRAAEAGAPADTAVLAVGFADRAEGRAHSLAGQTGELEALLLDLLGAERLDGAGPHEGLDPLEPGGLRAWAVPDTAAEARSVAAACQGADDVLVLVPAQSDADRVRAALVRNGIPVAEDAGRPLMAHGLGAVLAELVPVFERGGEASIAAETLVRVLRHPALSRSDRKGRRLPTREVQPLMQACRRHAATPAAWAERLRALRDAAPEPDEEQPWLVWRRQAEDLLVERLERLAVRSGEGTLRALAGFARDLGLSAPGEDPEGQTLLARLADLGDTPCTRESFAEACAGGLASGRVDEGVRILRYDAYDGRSSGLLVLTGLHTKGVAVPPAPDPFLAENDLAALGLASGARSVEERLSLLRWAVRRAGRVVALAARKDGAGRAVATPSALLVSGELVGPDGEAPVIALPHGLPRPEAMEAAPLPELRDLAAYGPEGEPHPSALQVDVEWVRSGAPVELEGALEPPPLLEPFVENGHTLEDLLERFEHLLPEAVRPHLGYLGDKEGGHLPEDFRLSASRLEHFTQCLYRALLTSVLRMKEEEELDEEYSAGEIGTIVHEALARLPNGFEWTPPSHQVEAERARLLEVLQQATEEGFARAFAELGENPGPAARAALEASRDRWLRHWERFVAQRVASPEEKNAALRQKREDINFVRAAAGGAFFQRMGLAQLETFAAAERTVAGKLWKRLKDTDGQFDEFMEDVGAALDGGRFPDVEAAWQNAVGTEAGREALRDLCARFRSALKHPDGDDRVVDRERAFGFEGEPPRLTLGSGAVAVRGSIDLVLETRGAADAPRHAVIDYKTGGAPTAAKALDALVAPQVAFYGLAVARGAAGEARAVGHVGYDRVKGERDVWPLDEAVLARAETTFGALLDRARAGRFTALPHPQGCPLRVYMGAWCEFGSVCRATSGLAPDRTEPALGEEEAR